MTLAIGGFRSFGTSRALRPCTPTGKVPVPGTRSGKTVPVSPPGGEALMETGMVVQERHTAPVGDRVGFFADAGHSLRLLPPEVTRETSRC